MARASRQVTGCASRRHPLRRASLRFCSFRSVQSLFDMEHDQSCDEVVWNGLAEREPHRTLGRPVGRELESTKNSGVAGQHIY
jgi:hypothetical protein